MAQVRLQRARIVAFIGECIATGVPQDVWVYFETEVSLNTSTFDHSGEACRNQILTGADLCVFWPR